MKKLLALLLGFILLAVNAEAQTHSCDKPQLTGNITVTNPTFLFAACVLDSVDADGIVIELNGTKTYVTLLPTGSPNAAGKIAFNVSVVLPARGNNTVRTAPFTLLSTGQKQEFALGSPFVLVYEKPAPTSGTTNHLR